MLQFFPLSLILQTVYLHGYWPCTYNVDPTGHLRSNNLTSIYHDQSSRQHALAILHLKCMASSHVNVKKGTPHVLLMASPHNTSESVVLE